MLITISSPASLLLLLSAAASLVRASDDPRTEILNNPDGTRYTYCQAPFPNSDTHPEPKVQFIMPGNPSWLAVFFFSVLMLKCTTLGQRIRANQRSDVYSTWRPVREAPSKSLISTTPANITYPSCNCFRTPTVALVADANVTWDCDDLGSYIYTSSDNHLDPQNPIRHTFAVARQIIASPRKSPFARHNWKGSCTPGQLTPLGAQQHRTLGGILRDIYVDRWKFLPADFDPATIYVRSTGKKSKMLWYKHCDYRSTLSIL